jgi:hypothetical protein
VTRHEAIATILADMQRWARARQELLAAIRAANFGHDVETFVCDEINREITRLLERGQQLTGALLCQPSITTRH